MPRGVLRMASEPLKVAHLRSQNIRGGAEIACHRISVALSQSGAIDSRVFALSPRPVLFEKLFAAWRYRIEHLIFGWGFSETLTPSASSQTIREAEWDIVHLHSLYDSGLSLEKIIELSRKVPTVWTVHDARWILWRPANARLQESRIALCRWGGRAAQDFGSKLLRVRLRLLQKKVWSIFPSTWLRDEAISRGLSDGKRSTVIPSPVASVFFDISCSKEQAKTSIGIKPAKTLVLFVAWKSWKNKGDLNKGYDLLEQVIPTLRSLHNFEFAILGNSGDPVPKHLKAICFYPDGSPEQVARIMRAADFIVGPSRQEALGLVVQEAHATGTPALVSGSTGYLDVVDDGLTGRYFEPGNSDDFVRQASRMLEDKEHLMEMGKRAREKALNRWHPAKVAEEYQRVYLEAIRDQAQVEAGSRT